MKASKEDAFIFMFGSDAMTMDEASRQYRIPIKVLKEYERWGLCGAVKKVMGAWQYDDTDIRRLSTIMTLHDVGFTSQEVETYMRLLLEQGNTDRDRRLQSGTQQGECQFHPGGLFFRHWQY